MKSIYENIKTCLEFPLEMIDRNNQLQLPFLIIIAIENNPEIYAKYHTQKCPE